MTPERFHKLRAVLHRRRTSLTVLLERVHKPHNLSAILRTCDAVGIYEANAVDPSGAVDTYRLTSGSAAQWVGLTVHRDVDAAARALRGRGLRLVAAHLDDSAVDFRAFDYTKPTCLVLGTERFGLSPDALALCEARVVVPMLGVVQSLNVSVAAAVILSEAARQRAGVGDYERRELASDAYDRILFEWCYPEIAEHCRRRGAAYPALDEQGAIVGAFPR